MEGWLGVWLAGWVGGWMDGWMGGWVGGWMDWVGGWMDGWKEVSCNLFPTYQTLSHHYQVQEGLWPQCCINGTNSLVP